MMSYHETSSPSSVRNEDDASNTATIIAVLVQVLICIWTISANGLVLLTVFRSRQLRSVMTSFLISLAAADFLLGVGMILSITITLWATPFWPCLVTYSILIGQCVASVWSLMGVAVDRYLHIVGNKSKWRITEHFAQVSIMMVWIASFITAIVPLLLHSNSTGRFEEGKTCFDFTALFPKLYLEFVFYGHECVPVLFMGIIYFRIIIILLQRVRRVGSVGESSVNENNVIKSRKELRVIIKLVFSLTVFNMCTFPMVIGILLEIYNPNFTLSPLTRLTMVALTYLNSAINPLHLWFFNMPFRRSCGRLLRNGSQMLTSCACFPRPPTRVYSINPSRRGIETLPSPTALPTINLTTYHCDEKGCKRTHHHENIHHENIIHFPSTCDNVENKDTCSIKEFENNPELPGMVRFDVDITRSEESTAS
nr:adenosine receptor A1-like [Lytechinus pictus]